MANSDIETKINAKKYSSIGNATAAVKRSHLGPKDKKRLLELVESAYGESRIMKNGHSVQEPAPVPVGPTHFGRQNTIDGMAFQVMRYALEQEQSIEVILDIIKHRIQEG